MPTTFKQDWTTAKNTFEATTKKKKPSASFLVMFSKGTGIGSSLESADKAKNAGELSKAMGDFQKASMEYFKLLDKAVSDPKTTPTVDKAAYAEAVKKLKSDLVSIQLTAQHTLEALSDTGAGKKDKVNPADLKKWSTAEKAVQAHTGRRLALAKLLVKTLSDYKAKGVEKMAENATKQAQAAKAAKAQGNTMGADVAAQTAARFAEEANKTMTAMDGAWDQLSTKGEMVDLRSDESYEDLPEEKKAEYKKNAGAAFRETEKGQRDINTYLGTLRSQVLVATSAAEGAESLMIGKLTPATYLKRVAEIQKQIEGENSLLGKYAGKTPKLRELQKQRADDWDKNPGAKVVTKKVWTDLKAEHEFFIPQAFKIKKDLEEMEKRLNGIPQDDKAVKEATANAKIVLARVRKLADDYIPQGQGFVKELGTYLTKV